MIHDTVTCKDVSYTHMCMCKCMVAPIMNTRKAVACYCTLIGKWKVASTKEQYVAISYNMGTRDLPDIYALTFGCALLGSIIFIVADKNV